MVKNRVSPKTSEFTRTGTQMSDISNETSARRCPTDINSELDLNFSENNFIVTLV